MKQILVVGGDPEYVRDFISKKLLSVGLNVTQHTDWGHKGKVVLPDGCEGLVLLGKEANKDLTKAARNAARNADIPLAECSERKFSHMLKALRLVGLIEGDNPRNVKMAESTPVKKVDKVKRTSLTTASDWATLYIEDRPERTDAEVVDLIRKEKETNGFTDAEILPIVQGVRSQLQSRWSKPHHDAKERAKVRGMKKQWAHRYFMDVLKKTGRPPLHDDIRLDAAPVFGKGLGAAIVTEILHAEKEEAIKKGLIKTPVVMGKPSPDPTKVKVPADYKEIQSYKDTINHLEETVTKAKDARDRQEAEAKNAVEGMRLQMREMAKGLETLRETVTSVERVNKMLKAENLTLSQDLEEALQGAEKSGHTIEDLVNMGWEIHIKPPQS